MCLIRKNFKQSCFTVSLSDLTQLCLLKRKEFTRVFLFWECWPGIYAAQVFPSAATKKKLFLGISFLFFQGLEFGNQIMQNVNFFYTFLACKHEVFLTVREWVFVAWRFSWIGSVSSNTTVIQAHRTFCQHSQVLVFSLNFLSGTDGSPPFWSFHACISFKLPFVCVQLLYQQLFVWVTVSFRARLVRSEFLHVLWLSV